MQVKNQHEAAGVAYLLNTRNQLHGEVSAAYVLRSSKNYVRLIEVGVNNSGSVVACAQCKQVQWYQSEVCHVSVHPEYEGKGYAKMLVLEAERMAKMQGSLLMQATIRVDNDRSLGLFKHLGYQTTIVVTNPRSGNDLVVLQKSLNL